MSLPNAVVTFDAYIGGAWVSLTADVLSSAGASGSWGIGGNKPDDRMASTGSMQFTLKSLAGKYNPAHSGHLTGWRLGLPVRMVVTVGAVTQVRFRGVIDNMQPRLTMNGHGLVDVTVVDWLDYAARYPLVTPAIETNKTADQALTSILAAMPIAPLNTDFDTGVSVFPALFDSVGRETRAMTEMAKIIRSEWGYIYLTHGSTDGETLVLENSRSRHGLRTLTEIPIYNDFSDSPVFNGFTLFSQSGSEQGLAGENVTFGDYLINFLKLTVYPKTVDDTGGSAVVLYALSEAISLAGGETKTIRGTYTDPAAAGNRVNGFDMITPAATTDYLLNSKADGSGTNLTSDLVISAVYGTESVVYTVRNESDYSGFITKLQARGFGIYSYASIDQIEESAASYNEYGYQTMTIDQPLQRDLVEGARIAARVVSWYKAPRSSLNMIEMQAARSGKLMSAFLFLDVGDLIRVVQPDMGVDGYYYIQSINFEARDNMIAFSWLLKQALLIISGLSMVSAEFAGLTPGGAATDGLMFGNLPQIANLTTITVAAWIYPHAPAGEIYQYTIGGNYNGSMGWLLAIDQDDLYLRFAQQGTRFATIGAWRTPFASITLDAWNHVAITRDTSSPTNAPLMYINGVSQSVNELSAQDGATGDDSGLTFQIGNIGYLAMQAPFNGYIRDFRIYSEILDGAAIDAIYVAGASFIPTGDTNGLVFAGPFVYTDDYNTYVPPSYGYRLLSADDKLIDGVFGEVGTATGDVFSRSAVDIIDHEIVLFGDSITEANGSAPTDKGYFNWLNVMLSQRWDVVYNAGVGGNSTAQMLARIDTDVIAYAPAWVMIMGGVNDIAAGTSSATILSNLDSILQTVLAAGMYPIISTLPPSTSFDTTAEGTVWTAVNAGIRAFATTYPGVLVVDAGPEYWDSSQPTLALPLSGYTVDGVHPNALGAGTLAAKMYTDLAAKAGILYPSYQGLAWADITANRLYYSVPNQMMAGTAGSKTAPATGDVATGFTVSAGGTWSKVARTDGKPGAWQQCVIGVESDQATFAEFDITTGFSVGDVIYAQVEFESDNDWTSPKSAYLYLAALNGSTVLSTSQALGHSTGGGSGTVAVRVSAGIYRTERMTIPATTNKIRVYFTAQMVSGTFRISRFEIVKVV